MNDKVTLAEIRAAVRRKLDDPEYDAAIIDEAANDFQNDLFTAHRIRSMEKSAELNVLAGDTTVDMPIDFLTLLEMVVADSTTQFRSIKNDYIDYNEFMRTHANYASASRQRLYQWTDFGNGIRFTAPSNGDYTIYLDYLRQPKPMVRESDKSEVKKVYKEMMTLGTLRRVMKVNEDYAEGGQEQDDLDSLITTFVRNEGRGGMKIGPQIMNTRRRRIGGVRRLGD
jgi:hypothetical protein